MATCKITDYIKPQQISISYTAGSNISIRSVAIYRSGCVMSVDVYFDATAAISNNSTIVSFASHLPRPVGAYAISAVRSIGGSFGLVSIEGQGSNKIAAWGTIAQGTYYYAHLEYLTY